MTTDSDDGKRLREVNKHSRNDSKRVIERIEDDGDSKDSRRWLAQSHRPPKGAVIRWERFLHVGSIKVLLVENDDSTRHVVTALLRNSNYEVIQAANGLQAWRILADVKNQIDLVLTEVVMPGLSGIGLLCKIMSHNLRKHIPVIMMSSHDSMALVFRCLTKGAVDFLVKPIRKNELKNLWQHIWRRCHSSSGSGSESDSKTQKSVNSKSSARSEECSSSGEAYNNNRSTATLKVGNGSEEGSGTQISSTKQAIEVDRSPALCSRDQTAECADNTCTLVIHPNNEVQLDHATKEKGLVARKRRKLEPKSNCQVKTKGSKQNLLPELEFTANSKRLEKMPAHQSVEYPLSEYKAVIEDPQTGSKSTYDDDSKEPVCIELNLKKLREDADIIVQSDRNVLTCSELSTFSRYNNTPLSATNDPNVITGNSSQPANTIAKKEYVCCIRPNNSNGNILQPSSNGISKNTDVGSATHKVSTDPLVLVSEPTGNDLSRPHDQELPVQQIHHHHHVHHFHDNNCLLNKFTVESAHCGSSDVLGILNRNGSDSKHGSSTGANAGGTNVQSNLVLEGKDQCGGETSLNKFCQKRKEPCLQNKVRYQNRQIHAEEQTNVQFVRRNGRHSSKSAMDE